MKQGLGSLLRVVAGIAGLVFLLAPITGMGTLVSMIALMVAIIAGVTSSHLSDDDGHGYWPKVPVPKMVVTKTCPWILSRIEISNSCGQMPRAFGATLRNYQSQGKLSRIARKSMVTGG